MLEHTNSDLWSAYGHTFYAPAIDENSIALDLGSSSALFAHEVAEEKGCQFHVVEALPEIFERIEETSLVKKHHFAICGEDKPQTFSVVNDEERWGLLRSDGKAGPGETVEVPGTTLKNFIEHIGAELVDLAKVDIEGAEIAMFGATDDDTLKSIKQISIEFHDFMDPRLNDPVQHILARMDNLGFQTFIFTRRFHGDVLFINPDHIKLPALKSFSFRYLTKYFRGIKRIAARGSLT